MKRFFVIIIIGGTLYSMLEILWRGNTHISMFIAGGICLTIIDRVCNSILCKKNMFAKCMVGATIITTVEFITGLIVNKALKLNVWDYSFMPINFMGQICIFYSMLWFFLSIPAILLCNFFDKIIAKSRQNILKKYL